ncbi:MAG TPA: methyltetrahydrofolate cobalamin methyltransferase, partial [Pseudorhizobium sp.]|nr:methyltetrahydrofolate cobalamin methyltransferase [Pseudorhizobium sp.]
PQEMEAVRAANVLNGTDENCYNWIKTYRDYKPAESGAAGAPAPAAAAAGGVRRGGRAARVGAGAATE